MKKSKILQNIVAIAVAASLIAGCFLFTGCDDKKKDHKKSKTEDSDDEDEDDKKDDKKDKEEKEDDTSDDNVEPSQDETEPTSESTEESTKWSDVEVNLEDPYGLGEMEFLSPSDFEDEYVQELAAQYYTKQGLMLMDLQEFGELAGAELGEDIMKNCVEGFVATNPDSNISINVSTEDDDQSVSGSINMVIVAKFDSADSANSVYASYLEESSAMGLGSSTTTDNGITTTTFEDASLPGYKIVVLYNENANVVGYDLTLDMSAFM